MLILAESEIRRRKIVSVNSFGLEIDNLDICRPVLVTLLHCHILHRLTSLILIPIGKSDKFHHSPIIASSSHIILLMMHLTLRLLKYLPPSHPPPCRHSSTPFPPASRGRREHCRTRPTVRATRTQAEKRFFCETQPPASIG